MTIKSFTFNPFSTNCYICHEAGRGVVVDPSCSTPGEVQKVLDYIQDAGISVDEILLTHAHLDHILGCRALAGALGVGIRLHRDELPLLEGAQLQARMFGLPLDQPPAPAGFLADGDEVAVGNATWSVLLTPGHSPGSVSFFDREGGYVISGDVLFAGSIGRTDLMGGSLPTLMQSIYQVLVPLGEEVRVLPGHGPETTLGREVAANPFLQED